MEKVKNYTIFELMQRRKIDFIFAYNHEIIGLIGNDLQQLLAILYLEGDEFAKRQIQEYCYKQLEDNNLLWEEHRGDPHTIYLLEKY